MITGPSSRKYSSPDGQPEAVNDDGGDNSVEDLFDARPAAEDAQPGFFSSKLAVLSKAYHDAKAWIKQLFASLGEHGDPVFDISSPFDVKKEKLSEEFAAAIAEHENKTRAAAEKEAFVKSTDLPATIEPSNSDPGREAFDAYIRFCKREKKQPGTIDCPQNFREGAERHAVIFLEMVSERKKAAQDTGQFWLSTEDQIKLHAAIGLAKNSDDMSVKRIGKAMVLGPIPTHSPQQLRSFMAWKDWWQVAGPLPEDADFSFDAAVAYANDFLAKYASKTEAKDPVLKEQLTAAIELIAKKDQHRRDYDASRSLAEISRDIDGLRKRSKTPANPQDNPALANTPSESKPPPAPPPPRVQRSPQAPTMSPVAAVGAPPASPPPRVATATIQRPAEWRNIPELSTLDPDLQVQGTVLLNQFFQRHARQLASGDIHVNADPVYFSEPAAVAAADFLSKAIAAVGTADAVDGARYVAANYIVQEYGRRKNTAPKPNG